jgi:eukaryotic-like serine/threonine-protein kinase
MDEEQRPDSWIGRTVGEGDRYKITRSLNAGGMGHVYVAIDTRLNNQQVAIKVLRDNLAGMGEMLERFKREVELCAALSSPNIVRIHDRGTTQEGFPFYVMEYLQGQSLGQLLHERHQLSMQETLEITLQICEGLQTAHAGVMVGDEHCQVVHRDLKPDNIFLQSIGRRWLVKILDFGIAKKLRDKPSEQASSATSFFLGTWRYSAPEQIEVHPAVDQRADIYSLGMIIYQMLTGHDPFGFWQDNSSGTLTTWWRAHTGQPPEPLRRQAGCELLPQALEDIVLKCLEKLPDDRFASVAELKKALDAVLFASHSLTRHQVDKVSEDQDPSEASTTVKPLPKDAIATAVAAANQPNPGTHTVAAPTNVQDGIPNHATANPVTPSEIESGGAASESVIAAPKPQSTGWMLGLGTLGMVLAVGGVGYYLFTAPARQLEHLKALRNTAEFQACMTESQAIPVNSSIYAESQEILNRCRLSQAILWEQQSKVQEAIALIKQIPSTSSLYEEAQKYLKLWEQI